MIERYRNEARRVLGVLESVLSKQEWLVDNKPTAADIAFILLVQLSAVLVNGLILTKELQMEQRC